MRSMGGAGDFALNMAASAKAGIKQILGAQSVQCRTVIVHMLGLKPDGLLPGQPQPFQILENGIRKVRTTAQGIDIFDAQGKDPAMQMGKQSGMNMAQMQISGWAGGESSAQDLSVGATRHDVTIITECLPR